MISGKKTKNLLKKAQTGKHKHTHKKSTRNSTEKNTNYETHSQKITPQKAQKQQHKLPNIHTKKHKEKPQTTKHRHKK